MATTKTAGATKRELLRDLATIARRSGRPAEFEVARLFVESIFDPRTPTYALGFIHATDMLLNAVHHASASDRGAYLAFFERACGTIRGMGYRENIHTYQEHRLMGSTMDAAHARRPYVPIGILEGKLAFAEALRARELAVRMAVIGEYYRSEEPFVAVALEPLDAKGRTLRDPRPIDESKLDAALASHPAAMALDICAVEFRKRKDFPFRRD